MNELGDSGLLTLTDTSVAKAANVMAVTRRDGSAPVAGDHPLGVYRDDSRVLSGWELTVDGQAPMLLAAVEAGPAATRFELTNPPLGPDLPLEILRLRLHRELDPAGGMRDRLLVRSHAATPLRVMLTLAAAADFRTMLEVRGFAQPDRAPAEATCDVRDDGLTFTAPGRDGVRRTTTITAQPRPWSISGAGLMMWGVDLRPGEDVELALRYAFDLDPAPAAPAPARTGARATLTLSDGLHQRALERALADLDVLESSLDGHAYFAAGIPWFATLFGRDSLLTATSALALRPQIAEDTLRLLAGRLGTVHDARREEEPGKVLHELRAGEALDADLTPVARYHGTVDATCLWLGLLADHADWTGSLDVFQSLRDEVDAMLGWLEAQGELLTYHATVEGGLRNQGWKDSPEAIAHADGTWLQTPIALCEAQGYAIRARRAIAGLLRAAAATRSGSTAPAAADPDLARADALDAAADAHAARLAERFRLPGGFSMGLDRDGTPADAAASNQGHLLWSRAVSGADAALIRDAVTGPELFSGWGVRTFGTAGTGYTPYGYHRGSVWPHDTAIVAAGLRAHGFDDAFDRVAGGLLDAATLAPDMRLPELFAGFDRDECPVPVPHPTACRPQAWSAAALPWLHVLGLGLRADGLRGRLHVERPRLPAGVDRAALRDLHVAGAVVDLEFDADGLTDATVRSGTLDVVTG